MSDPCEAVVERVALGEPLGDLAEHAASCVKCRRIAALPTELGATHRDSDPGAGFSARMTAGAQRRIAVRRRRRAIGGIAAAAAVAALATFALSRDPALERLAVTPDERERPQPGTQSPEPPPDPWKPDRADVDDDVRVLVQLANTYRSRKLSAHWRRIERPLEAYRIVVEGVDK
jgi:hypothetical protein